MKKFGRDTLAGWYYLLSSAKGARFISFRYPDCLPPLPGGTRGQHRAVPGRRK